MSEQENTPVAWQKQVRHKESGQLSWVDEDEYVSGWSYEETGETRALYAEPLRATSGGAGLTREDVILMARQAGLVSKDWVPDAEEDPVLQDLARFAELAVAAERKACAALCDNEGLFQTSALIRARGMQ